MAVVDERNFRSAYYEKVGCKSVEERKSLEILLKEKILDRVKLKQFCLRYFVPVSFRNVVWKVSLGVLPVYTECHNFIMDQKKQEYSDLLHALQVMKFIDNNFSKSHTMLMIFLLQTGNLKFDNSIHKRKSFVDIVQFLTPFCKDDYDLYWTAKGFYDNIKSYQHEFPKLIEKVHSLLEKEDLVLYNHLNKTLIMENLPLQAWFENGFSSILNYSVLVRIWDKLCGGSCTIFPYIVIVLLTKL